MAFAGLESQRALDALAQLPDEQRRAALRPLLLGLWRYAAVAVAAAMLAGAATWILSPHPERVSAKADNADLAKLEATNEVVFDVIACRGGQSDPTYEFAQLTLQAPNGDSPENPIVSWSAG